MKNPPFLHLVTELLSSSKNAFEKKGCEEPWRSMEVVSGAAFLSIDDFSRRALCFLKREKAPHDLLVCFPSVLNFEA